MEGSSYFKGKAKMSGVDVSNQGMSMLEGQVVKVHFIDDATNQSKKYVEYNVVARDAKGGTVTYQNCRYVQDISGYNDFSETILEPNDAALQGKLDSANFASNMNGAMVILAFLDKSFSKPIIIGGFPHRKNSGAKKADGIRRKKVFRGLGVEINKDGEYILTQKGPNSADGKQTNKDLNTEVKLDKTGNLKLSQSKGSSVVNTVELNRDGKKITLTPGTGGMKAEFDGTANKMTLKSNTDLKAEFDGAANKILLKTNTGLKAELDGAADKVIFQTDSGVKINIDGAGNIELQANSTKIKIDGTSGKITLEGNLVDVGQSASALAALGPQLVAWLSTHVHMGDGGPIPAPTSPPLVPPPPSVLSTSVKIKS